MNQIPDGLVKISGGHQDATFQHMQWHIHPFEKGQRWWSPLGLTQPYSRETRPFYQPIPFWGSNR